MKALLFLLPALLCLAACQPTAKEEDEDAARQRQVAKPAPTPPPPGSWMWEKDKDKKDPLAPKGKSLSLDDKPNKNR